MEPHGALYILNTTLYILNTTGAVWTVMALEKGGPGARKVRGGHYLVCQKKVAEAVLVYESKVVTKKKVSAFPIFPQIHGLSQIFTQNHDVL